MVCALALATVLPGQHGSTHRSEQSPAARSSQADAKTEQEPQRKDAKAARGDQNTPARLATHTSHTQLPPLAAWHFVKQGNERYVRSQKAKAKRTAENPSPHDVTKTHHESEHQHGAPIAKRPAGANRYVCAVLTCADSDRDVPTLLGLARRDVLELRVPGPFVTAEAIALLERTLQKYETSLILVLSHTRCDSLRIRKKGADDALDRRLLTLQNRARGMRTDLRKALGLQQREWILASSRAMRDLVKHDRLRIMPGVIDEKTGAVTWHQKRVQELPLSPVK